jgi:hypothetical protein
MHLQSLKSYIVANGEGTGISPMRCIYYVVAMDKVHFNALGVLGQIAI